MTWIKLRDDLATDPRTLQLAAAIEALFATPNGDARYGVTLRSVARNAALGALSRVWNEARKHAVDGVLKGATIDDLDAIAGDIPGFGRAMESVGWAVGLSEPKSLLFPNFEKWNVSRDRTAAERNRRYRERQKPSEKTADDEGESVTRALRRNVTSRYGIETETDNKIPLNPPLGETRPTKRRERGKAISLDDVTIPASLDTPDGRAAIEEWLAYKRGRGEAYKTAAGVGKLLAMFADRGPAALRAEVDRAMANNWAGLHPDNGRANGAPPSKPHVARPLTAEEIKNWRPTP